MPAEDLLTVVDAARYLGVRPWTLRHWISGRKIEFVKYGKGAVRLKRSVLDRFVANCTIKARNPHGARTKEPGLLERPRVGRNEEAMADRNSLP
jgi:excisionase family DNA binding protein